MITYISMMDQMINQLSLINIVEIWELLPFPALATPYFSTFFLIGQLLVVAFWPMSIMVFIILNFWMIIIKFLLPISKS